MHLDAGFLRDFFRGSVPEDKLNVLAERQLNELMHAMKCKCAGSPVPGKTLCCTVNSIVLSPVFI